MGRKSDYTTELADRICERIADGESLRQICATKDMPDRTTVMRWLTERPDFAAKYACARELQADAMDDLILETARKCTSADAQAAKVKIGAYQWRASKLKPKVYGDKIETTLQGPDGGAVSVKTEHDIAAGLAFTLRKGLPG